MKLLRTLLVLFFTMAALAGSSGLAETITSARFEAPVDRYGHFALGRPHEYARLTATTDGGRRLLLELPENEVFEDRQPRLLRLAAGEPAEILAIVSRRDSGSRLVMIRLHADRLEIGAQSASIGTPMRWLNPLGAADLDGDGRAEIAAVTTPHLGGTLRVYRRQGGELVEIAALTGFSNHLYGSSELGLATTMAIAGRLHLLVPDATRRRLRIVALKGDRLVETGSCALSAPVTGAVKPVSPSVVSVELLAGQQLIDLDTCGSDASAAQ